jgi:hypothetical protein
LPYDQCDESFVTVNDDPPPPPPPSPPSSSDRGRSKRTASDTDTADSDLKSVWRERIELQHLVSSWHQIQDQFEHMQLSELCRVYDQTQHAATRFRYMLLLDVDQEDLDVANKLLKRAHEVSSKVLDIVNRQSPLDKAEDTLSVSLDSTLFAPVSSSTAYDLATVKHEPTHVTDCDRSESQTSHRFESPESFLCSSISSQSTVVDVLLHSERTDSSESPAKGDHGSSSSSGATVVQVVEALRTAATPSSSPIKSPSLDQTPSSSPRTASRLDRSLAHPPHSSSATFEAMAAVASDLNLNESELITISDNNTDAIGSSTTLTAQSVTNKRRYGSESGCSSLSSLGLDEMDLVDLGDKHRPKPVASETASKRIKRTELVQNSTTLPTPCKISPSNGKPLLPIGPSRHFSTFDELRNWSGRPKFNGDSAKWVFWHMMFLDDVQNNPRLSRYERWLVLKVAVEGEVLQLIEPFVDCVWGYKDAIDTLRRVYGNKKRLLEGQLNRFNELGRFKSDDLHTFVGQLRGTMISVCIHLKQIGMMDKTVSQAIVRNVFDLSPIEFQCMLPQGLHTPIETLQMKMDSFAIGLWEKHLSGLHSSPPSLFLPSSQASIDVVTVSPDAFPSDASKPIVSNGSFFFDDIEPSHDEPESQASADDGSVDLDHPSPDQPSLCTLCSGAQHSWRKCTQFPTAKDKRCRIRSLKLCLRCMKRTHLYPCEKLCSKCPLCFARHDIVLCLQSPEI